MTAAGERIGVAVSGGADSVALLLALDRLAAEREIRLGIIHVNHALRGAESDADEAFVRGLAERLGLPIRVRRLAAGELCENLEAAGRAARYGFFEELLAEDVYDRVATGHTRSDQAETALFRLLRGAGVSGLAGVRPTREPGVIRPLIDLEGAEIRTWLREQDVDWREDSSNQDPRFDRNRLRHELLPLLRREWNPKIDAALARQAAQAARDEDYWRRTVDAQVESLIAVRSAGAVVLDCARAARVHPALLGRILRRLSIDLGASPDAFGADRVADLTELAADSAGDRGLDLPGLHARRSFRWLRLESSRGRHQPSLTLPQPLEPPMVAAAPDRSTSLTLRLRETRVYNEADLYLVDWKRVPKPLRLRCWRPGDALRRTGDHVPTKLRDLFQGNRVASWDRPGWPVIAAGKEGFDRVVWARGFGVNVDYAPSGSTVAALEVREITAEGREIRRIEDWLSGVYKG